MQFKSNLSRETYLEWVQSQDDTSFLQLPAWKEAGESNMEYVGHYVGIESQGQLVGTALVLVYRDSKLTMAYVPRGPILDYRNREHLGFFIESLKSFAKQLKVDYIRIEPPILYRQMNQKNEVVYESENDLVPLFKQHNMIHSGYFNGYHNAQPRYSFHLNLTKSYEELFKQYDSSVRTAVTRNELFKFKVEVVEPKSLDEFMVLREQLSTSKQFYLKPKSYFEVFYQSLKESGHVRYYQMSINDSELKMRVKEEIKSYESKIEELEAKPTKKSKGIIADMNTVIKALQGMDEQLEESHLQGDRVVGISICTVINKEMLVVYSHTDQTLNKFKLANILYDETFKDAKRIGCETLDFFGIPGIVSKDDPYYGLYVSKKSYGPEMVEYYGYFDYPVHKLKYKFIQTIRNRKLDGAKKRG